LGAVQVSAFEDGADASDAVFGFGKPTAVVVVESDRRESKGNEVERYVERTALIAGGPGDVGGKSAFAHVRIEEVRGGKAQMIGEAVVRIPRDSLSGIAVDPAWYASRVALGVPAADVARIAVWEAGDPAKAPIVPDPGRESNIILKRTLDGWMVEKGRPPYGVEDVESYALGVIKRLCSTHAETVGTTVPDEYEVRAFVQVYGASGPPIGAAEIGSAGEKTVVRSGEMVYVYEENAGGDG